MSDELIYDACAEIYGNRCSCRDAGRPGCDAILSVVLECAEFGIEQIDKADLTRCEINRRNPESPPLTSPVVSRDEVLARGVAK